MNTTYPSGPDLSAHFATPSQPLNKDEAKKLLPVAFDDLCKKCGNHMEWVPCTYWTRLKPFVTFQCPRCLVRLFIYEAPTTPLLVWSDDSDDRGHSSELIEERLREREEKRRIRAERVAGGT